MDPMQWIRQAQLMRSAMLRNPKASRQASDTFNQQVKAYLGERELNDTMYPGRAPGGSGATGVMANDSRGYANMLEEQQARQGLTSYLGGGSPQPNIKLGGQLPSTRTLDAATGRDNSMALGLPGWVSGGAIDSLRRATEQGTTSANRFASKGYGR